MMLPRVSWKEVSVKRQKGNVKTFLIEADHGPIKLSSWEITYILSNGQLITLSFEMNRLKISKLQCLPNYISLNYHKKLIVCTLDPLVIYTNVQKPVLFPLSFMFCATLVK